MGQTTAVEGNSDEPRPKAVFDTNPLSPHTQGRLLKVIRPQDQSVFVSKREFVLAHKSEVVSEITNSSLLPQRRIIAHSAGQCPLSLGGRSPPQPPSGVRRRPGRETTPEAVAAWTARSQTTPNAHRLRCRCALKTALIKRPNPTRPVFESDGP